MIVNEEIIKMTGYSLHIVPTKKYKTVTIVLKMKNLLDKSTVTERALVPFILQHASEKYPSYSILRQHLDDLYGMTFYVDLAKSGEYHVSNFVIDIANEKFLSDKTPLLKQALEFLNEVIFHPLHENYAFNESIVEQEKRNMKDKILSIYDDKMKYSLNKLVENMCKNERYSTQTYGYEEQLDKVTNKSLYEQYKTMLNTDEMDLYISGDIDSDYVQEVVKPLFVFKPRENNEVEEQFVKKIGTEKIEKEDQHLKQGKLNIGFRTFTKYGDEDYFALQVANGIFGGYSHSKLFINVREKASLAYYAVSRMESHKGLMLVMSGIDPNKFDQAYKIIFEQLEQMKTGEFTDEEIIQTKEVIKNQVLEAMDTQRGTIDNLYYNVIAKTNLTIDDWMKNIEEVTREQIIYVSKKIQLDTTFFLV